MFKESVIKKILGDVKTSCIISSKKKLFFINVCMCLYVFFTYFYYHYKKEIFSTNNGNKTYILKIFFVKYKMRERNNK